MMTQPPTAVLRSLWVTLEAEEVIELKRINLDRDAEDALNFFHEIVFPRVRAAAIQRGIALDLLVEDKNDERLPG